MKNKFSMGICGASLVFGLFLAGCASLNNLFFPIHTITADGEKVTAGWGTGQTVKIDGLEYPYLDRPAIPPAPKKPAEPQKPSPPTLSNALVEVTTTIDGNRRYTRETFPSREDLIRKINFYQAQTQQSGLSQLESVHNQRVVEELSKQLTAFDGKQKQYESAFSQYQVQYQAYQQALKNYEQENAAYQTRLPEYQAQVDAESKSIQDHINPDAPGNWDRYVDGKYLLYKGKAK